MALSAEAKAERAKYMREWRKKNQHKLREYSDRHWERKAEQTAAEKQPAGQGV